MVDGYGPFMMYADRSSRGVCIESGRDWGSSAGEFERCRRPDTWRAEPICADCVEYGELGLGGGVGPR